MAHVAYTRIAASEEMHICMESKYYKVKIRSI